MTVDNDLKPAVSAYLVSRTRRRVRALFARIDEELNELKLHVGFLNGLGEDGQEDAQEDDPVVSDLRLQQAHEQITEAQRLFSAWRPAHRKA